MFFLLLNPREGSISKSGIAALIVNALPWVVFIIIELVHVGTSLFSKIVNILKVRVFLAPLPIRLYVMSCRRHLQKIYLYILRCVIHPSNDTGQFQLMFLSNMHFGMDLRDYT